MGMSPAHRNQYLFSDHYLDNLLPADPRWAAGQAEAEGFLVWLRDLYAREQGQLADYNETQLEEHWFKPIFQRLGHVFERQAGVPGLDRDVKRPDYVFFPGEAARRAAVGAQNTNDYVAQALAVGEVKRWDLPLGKKLRGGGASFEAQNPSWQSDYYLRATGLDWGLLSNGRLWRLVQKDSSQRLSIYYEVDLVDLLSRGEADALRYFTLFFHQAAFRPDAQGRVFVDDALAASNAYAVALEEDLEDNVYRALEHLMQGFLDLPANRLAAADLRTIYDNSLYLLYRLLFILYAESRGLLPLDRAQYREQYSLMDIKGDIALGNAPTAPMTTVTWGRLRTLFHIINGDDPELNRYLGVPRYNGGLFSPDLHPFLDEKAVGDRALVAAIDLLSRRVTQAGREFVDYRTLGVRHLGSIYEGLLEYQPRYAAEPMLAVREDKGERWVPAGQASPEARVTDRRDTGQVYLETDRGERKATGSYYTPQYIVEYIVDNTLGPLVDEATARVKARAKEAKGKAARARAEQSLAGEILNLKVADPAMGSGHFLVEATDYLALALATDPYLEAEVAVEEDLVYWKRRVVERCIYGVDKNPLAVELAKLSLWLDTVAADRPLSFLDHHLRCGDSLIGARVDDLGWAPPPVLSKNAQKRIEQQKAGQINMFGHLLAQQLPIVMGRILEITQLESDSYDTVQAKEAADQAVRELKAPFQAVADLWLSAYFNHEFTPGDYDEALGLIAKPEALLALPAVARAHELAGECRFFHWELAFPEVFYDSNGQPLGDQAGFDAVVGNPPYVNMDRVGSFQSEYLRLTYPEIWMGQADYLYFFVVGGVNNLRNAGNLGYIVARYFIEAYFASGFRQFLLENTNIMKVIDFQNYTVFSEAGTKTCMLFLGRESGANKRLMNQISVFQMPDRHVSENELVSSLTGGFLKEPFGETTVQQSELSMERWTFMASDERTLVTKLDSRSWRLGQKCRVGMGMQTGANAVFEVSPKTIQEYEIEQQVLRKVVSNMEIQRYVINFNNRYWIYTEPYGDQALSLFPKTIQYLRRHRNLLEKRIAFRRGDCAWYQFSYPRHVDKYDSPKILVPFIAPFNRFALDQFGDIFSSTDSQVIFPQADFSVNLEYVVSLLNSSLLNWRYRHLGKLKDYRYEYSREAISQLPIRRIEFTTPAEERQALIEGAEERYLAYLEHGEDVLIRAFVAARLEAEPEQADVVHDLLAYMAEQMVEMNRQKQAAVEGFWLDLEGVTDANTFESLRNKGKWESTLWKDSACRPFVDENSRSTRTLDESLGWNEDAFKCFVKALAANVPGMSRSVSVYRAHAPAYAALLARIWATDHLIDQIVYKLYGLTDEEVAIVEGRSN
jgi:type I restriction-modification system DNA methylase subunit